MGSKEPVRNEYEVIAFDEVERKPNFDLWLSRGGYLMHGYMLKKTHIPVRTPKWPPRWSFAGACHGQ